MVLEWERLGELTVVADLIFKERRKPVHVARKAKLFSPWFN
jgi:hypothetical protein